MDKRVAQLLQAGSISIAAFAVFKFLGAKAPLLVYTVVVIAILNAGVCWALQFQRAWLGPVYNRPGIKHYVDLVCRVTGVQAPVEHGGSGPDGELLLTSGEDYFDGANRAKQVVRGHDAALDTILSRLRETVILRQRRMDTQNSLPPLAAFLLVGNDGVGKRYIARVLAKLLYRHASIVVFECDKLSADSLSQVFGAKGAPGRLIEVVRRQPFSVIVFEKIDEAPPELRQQLLPILQHGGCVDPDSGRSVAFLHSVFVFTTAKCQAGIMALGAKELGEKAWHQQVAELFASETSIEAGLLAALTEIIHCADPSDLVKAEVVAMLMLKEAGSYGIELTHIDPEILVAEVTQLNESSGFGLAPDRIKKVLHNPLVAATQQDRKTMALKFARRERKTVDSP